MDQTNLIIGLIVSSFFTGFLLGWALKEEFMRYTASKAMTNLSKAMHEGFHHLHVGNKPIPSETAKKSPKKSKY